MKKKHGDYLHINGRPRNAVVKLTADELAAMASELKSRKRTDGMTEFERRVAYVRKNSRG